MTRTKSAPAAETGEGADKTEAHTTKDTASTAGEQGGGQVEDDSSKTEPTTAAPGEPPAEPAAEEKKKDITHTYPESARMMRCDEVEKGFVMFDDHLSELMLDAVRDRKSTRLNSSHVAISYAVFCLKKKTTKTTKRLYQHYQR